MLEYFLGTSGYFYWHWQNRFYPEKMQPREWLQHYAKYFSTVEINSTYYHFPKKSSIKAWQKKVPKEFVFSIKGNRAITHYKKFRNCSRLLNDFMKQFQCSAASLAAFSGNCRLS